jgi:hypothetical protein
MRDLTGYSRRFGAIRPGLELISVEAVAVPVTRVRVDVLAQQRKRLPLLEEFVLRFADAGLRSLDEISGMCGMDAQLVESAVANLVGSGDVIYASHAIGLTSRGRQAVLELNAVVPVEQNLPFSFDRMMWEVADYRASDFLSGSQADERGLIRLPASKSQRIAVEDLSPRALNDLLKVGQRASRETEILVTRKVYPDVHRFLPADLLVFAGRSGEDIELAVVVDDELSEAHSAAVAAAGGASALNLKLVPSDERPRLSSELEAVRTIGATGSTPDTVPQVGSVSVFEHRDYLADALTNTKRRLLLISPWVRSAVVDSVFVAQLESLLVAGVEVHLGHGYGRDDRGSDESALARLAELKSRFPESFNLVRLPNTHAKILISDDYWISTSFNWLSFQGNPDRTYRMEEGTIVRITSQVDKAYQRFVDYLLDPE